MADVVIGAGVIGLHIAWYLNKKGRDVIVIDKDDATNNCSFGNAGYISPSHFVPLATPGIVWQGIKWMMDNKSPFYIKPRFNGNLLKWSYLFWKNASKKNVQNNASHLFNLLKLSRELSIDIHNELGQNFGLWKDGCLMLFTNKASRVHEIELAKQAKRDYSMDVPVLDNNELREMDPLISKNVLGGAYYDLDCHLNPMEMMFTLKQHLISKGVTFHHGQNIKTFEKSGVKVTRVITENTSFDAENVIIAAGSWSSEISRHLGIQIPLEAGKGYSFTYKNQLKNIRYPAILVDHRVAMTPFGSDLRVGGTMELSGINHKISQNRIPPIIHAANHYYDELHLEIPSIEKVWSGLRPVSPDGLPYIGRDHYFQNVYLGCGHAMIGISSAAATGLLLSQMISGQTPEIAMDVFRVNRF